MKGKRHSPEQIVRKLQDADAMLGQITGLLLILLPGRTVGERPCAEMVNEEIPAATKRIAGLPGLGAQDVGVKQAQIGPLVKFGFDLAQQVALEE